MQDNKGPLLLPESTGSLPLGSDDPARSLFFKSAAVEEAGPTRSALTSSSSDAKSGGAKGEKSIVTQQHSANWLSLARQLKLSQPNIDVGEARSLNNDV